MSSRHTVLSRVMKIKEGVSLRILTRTYKRRKSLEQNHHQLLPSMGMGRASHSGLQSLGLSHSHSLQTESLVKGETELRTE